MANAPNSSTILPPISMFTSSRLSSDQQTFMPASPPSSGYDTQLKSLSLLPKPHHVEYFKERQSELLLSPPPSSSNNNNYYQKQSSSSSSSSSYTPPTTTTTTTTTTPDQHTLWALFNQFQQQQQKNTDAYRYATDETDSNRRVSLNNTTTSDRALSSEEVLAEKRRRNAGASARFRDRRKQRERELQDKCNELEQRSKEFENALRRVEPDHPLLLSRQPLSDYDHRQAMTSSSPPPSTATSGYASDQNTLFDRVGQLEHLMTRFRQEKETDVQKLDQLEKENKYLRSLLVPVSLPSASGRESATDSDSSITSHTSAANKRKQHSSQDQPYKRIHLSPSFHHSDARMNLHH